MFRVNGDDAMLHLDPNFTTAGNPSLYKGMPRNQYWVEFYITIKDVLHNILHESTEDELIRILGWDYDKKPTITFLTSSLRT